MTPAPARGKGPRPRLVRDPIHGDIGISALEAAVIDTRVFQRLRYIRQDGLLHFIFPGAVHTRFAHSIGTMAVAGRVLSHLLAPLESAPGSRSAGYVRAVFRLAALLHDVGHGAFSHASEQVVIQGERLMGTLGARLTDWKRDEVRRRIEKIDPDRLSKPALHEDLGVALIHTLFEEASVRALCRSALRCPADDVATDVAALVAGWLPPSASWTRHASALQADYSRAVVAGRVYGRVSRRTFARDLFGILHSLVSGTLDVDRMDYLIRDSYYCGVPYGQFDLAVLVSNLSLGGVGGRLDFFLDRKAVDALDDMLWSRYQLFVQVINHKAHIALNKMLSLAMADAIADAHLERPVTLQQYLLFTDDHVMATVRTACLKGDLRDRAYAKALVDRRLPLHVGSDEDPGTEAARRRIRRARAHAAGVPEAALLVGEAESVLMKPQRFPSVLEWNRVRRQYEPHRFEDFSHFSGDARSRRRILHYFVDRDAVGKAG